MRRPIIYSILVLLIMVAACKQMEKMCTIRSYYNDSEKYNQTEIHNQGTISFYDTLLHETIGDILKDYSKISYSFPEHTTRTSYVVVNINTKSCSETRDLFNSLKQHEEISNCNMWMTTEEGNNRGIYDVFLCKIKHDSLKSKIPKLNQQTRTIYLKENKYGIHYIRADKNSNGDALDMANYFFETGYFDWAEPNYLGGFSLHD